MTTHLTRQAKPPAPPIKILGLPWWGRRFRLPSLLLCAASAWAQQPQNFDNVEVHVLPVQGNVYMLVGAGGNITMQVGKEGVLLVDTMYAGLSDKVLAAIRTVSDKPIRYIINTHVHGDHTGGNEKLAKAGSTITGGNVVGDIGAS